MHRAMARGGRISLLLVKERSIRLLVHEDFKDRVTAIRAKVRSGPLTSQDR